MSATPRVSRSVHAVMGADAVLYERLDRQWFKTRLRARLDDGVRQEWKDRFCARGLILLKRWRSLERRQTSEFLRAELDAARAKLTAMHRRAQEAESIIAKSGLVEGRPQSGDGRSLGRALANYAAAQAERENTVLRARIDELVAGKLDVAAVVKENADVRAELASLQGVVESMNHSDARVDLETAKKEHAALVTAVRIYLEAESRIDAAAEEWMKPGASRFFEVQRRIAVEPLLAALPQPTKEEVAEAGRAFEAMAELPRR